MNYQVKWGIAAAGRITNDFVNAIGTLPRDHHKIVAVADAQLKLAKEFAEKHQIPKFYEGFENLAKDPDVDIVYIGTLNPFHYSVARLMLDNGKNVLCEKPICLCYSDAKKLYELAELKNVFLMEAMWSRCFPSYKKLLEILNKKDIGKVQEIHVSHGFKAQEVQRIVNRNLGGGITLDIGIYTVQLAQLVYGKFPKKISAKGKLINGVDVESEIQLEYEDGGVLIAKVSGLENCENKALIIGTKGQIIMENYWCCDKLILQNGTVEEWPLPSGKFEFNHKNACGLRYEAEVVRDCLQKNLKECPLYTHKQSLEMVQIEDEVRRQLGVFYDDPTN